MMNVSTSKLSLNKAKQDAVVAYVSGGDSLAAQLASLQELFPGVGAALSSGDITGKAGSSTVLYTGEKSPKRLIVVGLGEAKSITVNGLRKAASAAIRAAGQLKLTSVASGVPSIEGIDADDAAQAMAEGAILGAYSFGRYFSDAEKKNGSTVTSFVLVDEDKQRLSQIEAGVYFGSVFGEATNIARDLGNTPNCDLYPELLAEEAKRLGKQAGVKVTVLDKKKITSLGMNGLLAVNAGSERPPVFIVMEYNGGSKSSAPFVIVGKGVTFDTGGISLKPGAGMADMKMDMHGAATAIATIYAVAKAKLPVNVVALVPATENMPDGHATVPGDIITYSNGTTVEVDNTDAEGRLILADALLYAAKYKPAAVVDLATLTGACVIALGHVTTGLISNDKDLTERLKISAEMTSEYVCELPTHDEYKEQLKSDVADMMNVGGRAAGTITAGLFLQHFTSYPWAHLDIAGTGMVPKPGPYSAKGASGVGVRLLADLLRRWNG